jgi:hypothetical protein
MVSGVIKLIVPSSSSEPYRPHADLYGDWTRWSKVGRGMTTEIWQRALAGRCSYTYKMG